VATACASTSTRPHRHSAAVPRSAAARVCGTFVEVHIERPGSLSDPDAGVGPCGDPTKIEMYEKKWDLIIEGTGWDLQARGPAQNIGPGPCLLSGSWKRDANRLPINWLGAGSRSLPGGRLGAGSGSRPRDDLVGGGWDLSGGRLGTGSGSRPRDDLVGGGRLGAAGRSSPGDRPGDGPMMLSLS
jgi:hypothetical protein